MSSPDITWGPRTSAKKVAEAFSDQLKGRVALLTGPSIDGVGLATALALANQEPAALILLGRSSSRLEASKAEVLKEYPNVDVRNVQCDLSSIASVLRAAQIINAYKENIDIVVNNAAVMDTPFELTPEGFELQFASNYLGHYVLVEHIMPKILASDNKRVVMVSSMGHANCGIRWDDPNYAKGGYEPGLGYGQSKTACNLYAINLTARFGDQGLTAFSLHPGGIETGLQKHWTMEKKMAINEQFGRVFDDNGRAIFTDDGPWKTPDQGAATSLRAALDPSLADQSGAYLDDCKVAEAKSWASDKKDADKLIAWTDSLIGSTIAKSQSVE